MLDGNGTYESPAGTTTITPRAGIAIADSTGRILEQVTSVEHLEEVIKMRLAPNGEMLTARNIHDLRDYVVTKPGQTGSNYTLLHPAYDNLPIEIFKSSTTTIKPTYLSDFLRPDMGCVFWAACTFPYSRIPR